MKAQGVASAIFAAVVAALVLPLIFIAAESVVQGVPVVADDFGFAFALAGPFALAVALGLAWPSYALQSSRSPVVRRLLIAAVFCFAAPIAVFSLLSNEFAWKAGIAGIATLLIWLSARRLAEHFTSTDRAIRSEPSG